MLCDCGTFVAPNVTSAFIIYTKHISNEDESDRLISIVLYFLCYNTI